MRLGLVLMSGSVRGDVALALRAERAGFASVFTIEFFNRHGFIPLAAVAVQTSRVRLGTGIANAFTRARRSCTRALRWTSTSSRAGA